MRLSSDQESPDYHAILSPWSAIYLDGVRIKNAVEADEEAGYVRIDGRLYGYEMPNGELTFGYVVLKGNVEIQVPEIAPEPARMVMADIRNGLLEGRNYGSTSDTGQRADSAGQNSPA